MMPYTIRPARAEDISRVEATLRESDLPLNGLREQFGDGYAVAEASGELIGVEGIEVYGSDGLLRSAAVVPGWRGMGVGDALTRDRIEWAKRRGLKSLYLLTMTAGDYWPRFGFRSADRNTAPQTMQNSPEFTEACPSSAVCMSLPLTENKVHD